VDYGGARAAESGRNDYKRVKKTDFHFRQKREGLNMAQAKTALSFDDATFDPVRVRARVNRFLFSRAGSHFAAGEPALNVADGEWKIPILLITPGLIVGEVGHAVVTQETHEITSHTPVEELQATAQELRKLRHAEIEAAFLRARKA
jgi:hypothetical protein